MQRNPHTNRFGGSAVKGVTFNQVCTEQASHGRVLHAAGLHQEGRPFSMGALSKSILLFILNWLDAQLTLVWVRTNLATEGNGLMARLLDLGDNPFLLVKIAIGAFAAYVLYRCAHLKLARGGMQLVLGIYLALMFVHAATGLSALGWQGPEMMIGYLGGLPQAFASLFS